jgi:hypothetical protein
MYYYKRLQEANKMRDYWGDRKFKFHQRTLGEHFIQKRMDEKAKNAAAEDKTENQE